MVDRKGLRNRGGKKRKRKGAEGWANAKKMLRGTAGLGQKTKRVGAARRRKKRGRADS